jgi:hypothetical protein
MVILEADQIPLPHLTTAIAPLPEGRSLFCRQNLG